MLKKLLGIFLGPKSQTESLSIDFADIYAAIRSAVIVAAVLGGITFVESIDAADWGLADTLVASASLGLLELARKWLKDYSK